MHASHLQSLPSLTFMQGSTYSASRNMGSRRAAKNYFRFVTVLLLTFFNPSSATTEGVGDPDYLVVEDTNDIERFLEYVEGNILPEDIAPGDEFGSGLVEEITFTFHSGNTYMVRLAVLDRQGCNLGKGSELMDDDEVAEATGEEILNAMHDVMMPSITRFIRRYYGSGYIIHENFFLTYFYLGNTFAANPQSDNDTNSHNHQEFLQVGSMTRFGNQTRNDSTLLTNPSKIGISRTVAGLNTTFNVSETSKNLAVQKSGRGMQKPPFANGESSPQRKFPITPAGDCDITSLMLWLSGYGSNYDESSTHSLRILNPTDKIWSPSARFYVVMQLDCNLVLYDVHENKPIWASHTDGKGTNCFATITVAGELIVYDTTIDNVLWRSYSWCSSNGGICFTDTVLQVQDDGNLVLYILATQDPLWDSQTMLCQGGCYD
ncbi:hypothetical protein Mapa_008490 [Marchantia paleacea]|nr:hypothetical protein Mapa_008490 [Marchantia paleacea]